MYSEKIDRRFDFPIECKMEFIYPLVNEFSASKYIQFLMIKHFCEIDEYLLNNHNLSIFLNISNKTYYKNLKELEREQFIVRKSHNNKRPWELHEKFKKNYYDKKYYEKFRIKKDKKIDKLYEKKLENSKKDKFNIIEVTHCQQKCDVTIIGTLLQVMTKEQYYLYSLLLDSQITGAQSISPAGMLEFTLEIDSKTIYNIIESLQEKKLLTWELQFDYEDYRRIYIEDDVEENLINNYLMKEKIFQEKLIRNSKLRILEDDKF
jgi:hypothetical protein